MEMGIFSLPCLSSSTIRYFFYFCLFQDLSFISQILLHAHIFLYFFFSCSYTISSLLCSFTLILCLSVMKKILFCCLCYCQCYYRVTTCLYSCQNIFFCQMSFSQPTFIFHFQFYREYKFSNGQNLNVEKALEAQIGPQNILKQYGRQYL